MKKIISLTLTVITLCTLLCSCGSSSKTATVSGTISNIPPYGSRQVTVLGDSIAAGYGLDDQSQNYVSIFSVNIGATLKNDAVSGYDSTDLLAQINIGTTARDIMSADIIIISIGGNDVLHQKDLLIKTIKDDYLHGGKPFPDEVEKIYTDFEANLRSCISAIRSLNSTASIIIQTIYNPVLKQGYKISGINVAKTVNKYIVRLNESITTVCKELTNVCVFDVAAEMNKDEDNFYKAGADFDIHPTVHGHKSLADIYTKDFNEIVK